MHGEGAGGESLVESVMDELKDWSTSMGKSTSVRAGDAAGERSGESNRPGGNVSVNGDEENASIVGVGWER